MVSICDGCQEFFNKELTVINAKKWKESLCDIPMAQTFICRKFDCVYNFESMCIEYQFCDECLSSQDIIDKIFEEFASPA